MNKPLTFVAAALALALSALSAPAAEAAEKLEVALNWVAGGDHAPLYYAKKMGLYIEAGIDLDLQTGKGSVGSIQRVSVGASQVKPFDVKTAYTNEFLDPSIKLIEVKEP